MEDESGVDVMSCCMLVVAVAGAEVSVLEDVTETCCGELVVDNGSDATAALLDSDVDVGLVVCGVVADDDAFDVLVGVCVVVV